MTAVQRVLDHVEAALDLCGVFRNGDEPAHRVCPVRTL